MTVPRSLVVVGLVSVASVSCSSQASQAQAFVEEGKRLAGLPEACTDSAITGYERASREKYEAIRDGESFKVRVNSTCYKQWRVALSEMQGMTCNEDLDYPTTEGPLYYCFSGKDIVSAKTHVIFRDEEHAELMWVTFDD